jgi:electron transfer flavoprotein beta subunit
MRVAVCLRAVVDEQAPVASRENEIGSTVTGPFVTNPVDLEALEMALQFKDRSASVGVTVAALSVAPPAAGNKVLQAALSVGTDEVALFWDEQLLEADTLGIAHVLTSALHASNFDLILFGDRSADSGTGQVPHQVAEILELPCLDRALAVTLEGGSVIVEQAAEPGIRRRVRCPLPTVVVVMPAGRVLRYPRTADRLRAQASAVPTLGLAGSGGERRPP